MVEVVVTRNGQITLTKELREELSIRVGDKIIMNLEGNRVVLAKKDPKVWDEIGSFLPENFSKVLEKIRADSTQRFKDLGVLE